MMSAESAIKANSKSPLTDIFVADLKTALMGPVEIAERLIKYAENLEQALANQVEANTILMETMAEQATPTVEDATETKST